MNYIYKYYKIGKYLKKCSIPDELINIIFKYICYDDEIMTNLVHYETHKIDYSLNQYIISFYRKIHSKKNKARTVL